jgi:hypothetical protein
MERPWKTDNGPADQALIEVPDYLARQIPTE